MEAHLVHRDSEGKLAVVGVFLKEGQESAGLKAVWKNLPRAESETTVEGASGDASTLLPAHREYYIYPGSLTTPPCSEGVSWFVMAQAVEVSAEQIETFRATVPPNARPVQPLNGRGALAAVP
jgi:carbonic anhydrase